MSKKLLEDVAAEVRPAALSQQAVQVINRIDEYLDYYQRARGSVPARVMLRPRQWEQIRRSMERAARQEKAPVKIVGMTCRGITLQQRVGIERGETA